MPIDDLRLKLQERPYLWAYIVGGSVLILCSILWWFIVFLGTQHVFWSMISNSLDTRGVVIQTSQSQGKTSLQQSIQVDTSVQQARSLTILTQNDTTVKTEVIGTKDADYTRYVDIASKTKTDTSKIKNVWSKSDDTQQSPTQSSGHQLYAQATLGIGLPLGSVPVAIGALPAEQRSSLYNSIRNQNLYKPDFGKVKKEWKHGRLLYTYQVKVQTLLYISMMKDLAKALGLHELEAADPNSFSNTPTFTASVTVDALSHQLAAVNFTEQGYSQTYQSFGLPLHTTPPKSFITSDELQKRLVDIGQASQ